MRQAGQGIGAAGEMGLVHRDIKPENLLLTRKGRLKIGDFGLCRDLESDQFHVTQPGVTLGTPLYMSPEQAQGKHLDHRSDLYSLGVTFYHMLVGEPPFRADSAVALALKQVSETPLGLRVRRPEIPVELERLVLKLMAKSPTDRYQSAAEMLGDLAKVRGSMLPASGPSLIDEKAISLPPEELSTQGTMLGSDATVRPFLAETSARPASPRLASPWLLALAGLLCLLGGGALGWASRPSSFPRGERAARRLPALGIEPRWSSIPKQASAEEQYRFAQFRASDDDQTAAWLAVAGHFHTASEWASPAYVQLARRLYRERDLDRLSGLKEELAAWTGAKTGDQELVQIVDTAIKLCHKDYEGVIKGISQVTGLDDRAKGLAREEPSLYDPGKLEFCLEIVSDALHQIIQPGSGVGALERDRLAAIKGRLHGFLRRVQMKEWWGGRPAAG
jgi:serine/threonine-protein kinase